MFKGFFQVTNFCDLMLGAKFQDLIQASEELNCQIAETFNKL